MYSGWGMEGRHALFPQASSGAKRERLAGVEVGNGFLVLAKPSLGNQAIGIREVVWIVGYAP